VRLATTLLKDEDNHILIRRIFTGFILFTDRLSNKPFLISLLTSPPHLKYVFTPPSNLLLIAYFQALMFFSEGSMSTYARFGVVHNNHFTANLLENLPVKEF